MWEYSMQAIKPKLKRFQRDFLRGALAPGIDTAALSLPRGNGKTWLAAYILARCLTPRDKLNVVGAEYLLCAASLEQARLAFRFVRETLETAGRISIPGRLHTDRDNAHRHKYAAEGAE